MEEKRDNKWIRQAFIDDLVSAIMHRIKMAEDRIPSEEAIVALIQTELGVIENGTY